VGLRPWLRWSPSRNRWEAKAMGRWVQRDAQTWWAIIQRQMESGLSQVAFCA
jgi:hypothetical protein